MNISPWGRLGGLPMPESPHKLREAGRQFEALLITQLLQSARGSGTGWLGAPEDSTSDCATDFAEQQFAEALACSGGLGIAHMIETSLREPPSPPERKTSAPGSASPVPKSPEP
jgi:Rod binding domain-containing protein